MLIRYVRTCTCCRLAGVGIDAEMTTSVLDRSEGPDTWFTFAGADSIKPTIALLETQSLTMFAWIRPGQAPAGSRLELPQVITANRVSGCTSGASSSGFALQTMLPASRVQVLLRYPPPSIWFPRSSISLPLLLSLYFLSPYSSYLALSVHTHTHTHTHIHTHTPIRHDTHTYTCTF